MDKYYITLGKLSCVCGSVRISNFQNHITKIVMFSASLLLSIRWYLFKDGFSKAHQLNYTVQGGNVSFVSDVAWLHNRHYPVVWMYSLICIQPGGGDDHADQRKALRTQSICSRSMLLLCLPRRKKILHPNHNALFSSFLFSFVILSFSSSSPLSFSSET